MSEKANDLLNKFGSAQFDFMIWNTPDNLVARDKARQEISDYIAELEAAQVRWIPVSERLPELDQDVLAIVEGDIVTGHFYQQWDGEIYFSSDDEGAMMVATHWMPLPQPPEVQE
jgi:hypothetical protein